MKKLLVEFMFLIMSMFASYAWAQVDTSGLSRAQEAELTLQAEKMKQSVTVIPAPPPPPPQSTVKAVSEWAEAGKGLAVGLGAGAKEIGIAVNEFADTRVGRITTYVIIWKLMGKEILGLIFGSILIFVAVPAAWKVFRYLVGEVIEYEDRKFLWMTVRRKKSSRLEWSGDGDVILFIIFLVSSAGLLMGGLKMLPF